MASLLERMLWVLESSYGISHISDSDGAMRLLFDESIVSWNT
jgi:hypothetical protein